VACAILPKKTNDTERERKNMETSIYVKEFEVTITLDSQIGLWADMFPGKGKRITAMTTFHRDGKEFILVALEVTR